MKTKPAVVTTERLILRQLQPADAKGIFELDSDPEVHRYVGNKPITTLKQAEDIIEFIRAQYRDNGIGRWAVEEKSTGNFLGWAGLKLITDPINGRSGHYDVGYRLIRRFWGQGFATEATKASIDFGFQNFSVDCLYAIAHKDNKASRRILEKSGFIRTEDFLYDGEPNVWYELKKSV